VPVGTFARLDRARIDTIYSASTLSGLLGSSLVAVTPGVARVFAELTVDVLGTVDRTAGKERVGALYGGGAVRVEDRSK
jgi:hypothetical protein